MEKLNKGRILLGIGLLLLVAIMSAVCHAFEAPTWPAFMVMIFFFMGDMDKKLIPKIIVGAGVGILLIIPIGILLKVFGPVYGKFQVMLVFTMVFVSAIIVFGEMIPIILNNYAFTTMLMTGITYGDGVKVHLFKLVAAEVIGGLFFIGGIIGIIKLLTALAAHASAKRISSTAQ